MGRRAADEPHLHDLVRSQGEPRWTAVVDAVLGSRQSWPGSWCSAMTDPGPTLRIAVPLVLAVVVVVRVLVLVEHVQRWRDLGLDEAPAPSGAHRQVAGPSQPSRAA